MRWHCDYSFPTSKHTDAWVLQCSVSWRNRWSRPARQWSRGSRPVCSSKEPRDSLVVTSNRRLGERVLIGVLGVKHSQKSHYCCIMYGYTIIIYLSVVIFLQPEWFVVRRKGLWKTAETAPHGRFENPLIVTLMKLIKVGEELPEAGWGITGLIDCWLTCSHTTTARSFFFLFFLPGCEIQLDNLI